MYLFQATTRNLIWFHLPRKERLFYEKTWVSEKSTLSEKDSIWLSIYRNSSEPSTELSSEESLPLREGKWAQIGDENMRTVTQFPD